MEAIPLSGINPHAAIFKPRDITLEQDVLFYPRKSIEKNELTDVVAFELIDQTPGKIYDSVESNGFLFSQSTEDLINEEEYAIISDSEDNCCAHGENLSNGETFVTIGLENGQLHEELNGCDSYGHEKPKIILKENRVPKEVLFLNGDAKKQVTNGSISKAEIAWLASKPEITVIKNVSNGDTNIGTNIVNGEHGNGNEKDLLYSYENTSTPNKDYEMKILAGRNEVSELSLSTSEMEVEEKSDVLLEQPKNVFKLKSLSTRTNRPYDDLSLPPGEKSMNGIPLEELRNLQESEHGTGAKINLFPKYPLSVSEYKMSGPIPVIPLSRNMQRSLPNSLHSSTESKGGQGSKKNSLQLKFGLKDIKRPFSDTNPPRDMKRSLSDIIPPKESDLDVSYIDKKSDSRSRLRAGRNFPTKKVKDDSFFEIDNRYDEFVSNINFKPIELEMKTILCSGLPDDTDILSASTEIISPEVSMDLFTGNEVTTHYISFYRQQQFDCKFITLAFFKVNQPKILVRKLDVPYEEVVEQIYTHLIEEIIIYEDEFGACKDMECSICDDEWFIIK